MALLAFLARDATTRERGLGEILLLEALRQCIAAAEHIGLPGVFLEATEEGGPLYERFGFSWIDRSAGFMYLPMTKVRAIIEVAEDA